MFSSATLSSGRSGSPRGYFAFDYPGATFNQPSSPSTSKLPEPESPSESTYYKEWARKNEESRQKREERERLAILRNEYEWVRSGGVLRDANGRRDQARTARIKAEVEAEEARLAEEKRIRTQWDRYETRWTALVASTSQVRFADVPWPVEGDAPTSARDVTPAAVETFIFASLKLPGNTVTRKERIRASYLRWHPDKIASMLARVAEEHIAQVREGIGAVMTTLKALQDVEKAGAVSG